MGRAAALRSWCLRLLHLVTRTGPVGLKVRENAMCIGRSTDGLKTTSVETPNANQGHGNSCSLAWRQYLRRRVCSSPCSAAAIINKKGRSRCRTMLIIQHSRAWMRRSPGGRTRMTQVTRFPSRVFTSAWDATARSHQIKMTLSHPRITINTRKGRVEFVGS